MPASQAILCRRCLKQPRCLPNACHRQFELSASQSFGAGATGVGFASSAFSLARLALNVPSGMLGDRYGRRPLLILGPLLMAVGTLLCRGAAWECISISVIRHVYHARERASKQRDSVLDNQSLLPREAGPSTPAGRVPSCRITIDISQPV